MRAFIAVEIDTELRLGIERLRDRLRRAGTKVKWVRATHTHLTLKFIGDIPDDRAEEAAALMADAAAEAGPFDFEIAGAGRFPPHSGNVRVLWVGVNDPTGTLEQQQKRLNGDFERLGVEREHRPFSAHLTLGRVKKPHEGRAIIPAMNAEQDAVIGTQHVGELVLFESDLRPDGPVYTVIARAPLGRQS